MYVLQLNSSWQHISEWSEILMAQNFFLTKSEFFSPKHFYSWSFVHFPISSCKTSLVLKIEQLNQILKKNTLLTYHSQKNNQSDVVTMSHNLNFGRKYRVTYLLVIPYCIVCWRTAGDDDKTGKDEILLICYSTWTHESFI